jgi:hypothetical protein
MKKPALIVLVGLIVLLGVGGCSSSTLRPQHQPVYTVTGFAGIPFIGGVPSGPVTVRLTEREATRLALLVRQLPSVPQSQVHCEEPLGLTYRIVSGPGDGPEPTAVVEGYRCDAAVTITVPGQTSSWRRDANCALIRAVRHVLPRRAKATQTLGVGCGS